MRRWIVTVAAVAALLIGGLTVASAARHATGTTFFGCVQRSNGSLYSVGTTSPTCNKQDTLISWSQTGPAGAAGPIGPAGPTGPQGPAGANGVRGYQIVQSVQTIPAGYSLGEFGTFVVCPVGDVGTGGGWRDAPLDANLNNVPAIINAPLMTNGTPPQTEWLVMWQPQNHVPFFGQPQTVTTYIICVATP
jgi:hypothetical protein